MIHYELPTLLEDYAKDAHGTFWSVIEPEETTNLLTNPSFEAESHFEGWTVTGAGTISADSPYAYFGRRGVRLLSAGSLIRIETTADLTFTARTPFTFSVFVKASVGQAFALEVAGQSFPKISTWAGWQQWSVTVNFPTTTVGPVGVTFAGASGTFIYLDGCQVEQKAYATTYCDGDRNGFGLLPYEYWWNGIPHASTSTRHAQCTAGGRKTRFYEDLRFFTTGIVGLGLAPYDLLDSPTALGVSLHTGVMPRNREFTIVGTLYAHNRATLHQVKGRLMNLLRPKATGEQPIVLTHTPLDAAGNPLGPDARIACFLRDGLSGNYTSDYGESLALKFVSHSSFLYEEGEAAWSLTNPALLDTDADPTLLLRDGDVWNAVGRVTHTSIEPHVYATAFNRNGLWVGGQLTHVDAVAAENVGMRTNAGVWSATIRGTDGPVTNLAGGRGPATNLMIAGGPFAWQSNATLVEGVMKINGVNADQLYGIAYFDPSDDLWHRIGPGLHGDTLDPLITSIVCDATGRVYVAGEFTMDKNDQAVGGVVRLDWNDQFGIWTGSVWHACGGGGLHGVTDMTIGMDGKLYVCGSFGQVINGVDFTGLYGVACYDPNADVWMPVGRPNAAWQLFTIDMDPQTGRIYVGGYTTDETGNVWVWTGSGWQTIVGLKAIVHACRFGRGGRAYLTGVNFVTRNTAIVTLRGGVFAPSDLVAIGSDDGPSFVLPFTGLSTDGNRFLLSYVEPPSLGIEVAAGRLTTVIVDGLSPLSPILSVTGRAILTELRNETTGRTLFFRNFEVFDGETIHLDLTNPSALVTSNVRTVLLGEMLEPTSDIDRWELAPGPNRILLAGSYFNTNILMQTLASATLRGRLQSLSLDEFYS